MKHQATKVLFVCMGNICRSPTAHAVMAHRVGELNLADRITLDSAGTHAYHVGEQSDSRSRATARKRGIDMDFIRARKLQTTDFTEFDYIYAMDDQNLGLIRAAMPAASSATIEHFLAPANRLDFTVTQSVPDPYYGGDQGFEEVFDLVETGCQAILHELNRALSDT